MLDEHALKVGYKEIDNIFNYAQENLRPYQPWENYYRLRRKELQMILHFSGIPKVRVMLELGCGAAKTAWNTKKKSGRMSR